MLRDKHVDYEIDKIKKLIRHDRTGRGSLKIDNNLQQTIRKEVQNSQISYKEVVFPSADDYILMQSASTGDYQKVKVSNVKRGVNVFVQGTAPEKPNLHDIWIKI